MFTTKPRSALLYVGGLAAITVLGVAAACEDQGGSTGPDASRSVPIAPVPAAHSHGSHGVPQAGSSARVERQLAQLRAVTAPFHRFEAAADAGWGTRITDCFSDPELGGMGYHYGNVDLIDGVVDPLAPELLLYEPMKNGRLRFVAVEYIVPFDAWQGSEPPQLFGLSFGRNDAFGLWVLHVWHFRNNPSGIFADWNPDVTCAHAAP